MKIKVSKESVVLQGPAYEDTIWGVMQFPTVFKTKDGKIVVRVHTGDDVWTEIGQADKEAWCISSDLGKTFTKTNSQKDLVGTVLSNGDRIYFPAQPAILIPAKDVKVRRGFTARIPSDKIEKQEDGSLPYPIFNCYDRVGAYESLIYDYDTLPDKYAVREWKMLRTTKDGKTTEESVPFGDHYMSMHLQLTGSENAQALYPYPICSVKTAPDGSVWACTYTGPHLNPFNKAPNPTSAAVLYKSTDNAKTFKLQSYIPFNFDTSKYPTAYLGDGFNECDMEMMDDGSIIVLLRTADVFCGGPEWNDMYYMRSTDGGKTFSEPVSMGNGVLPSLVKLGCGVTLAAYGRPGIFIRPTIDGVTWGDPIEIMTPNDRSHLMNNPPERPNFHQWAGSCCNVNIKAYDDNHAMLVYSDFYYPDQSGKTNKKLKTILMRMIEVEND